MQLKYITSLLSFISAIILSGACFATDKIDISVMQSNLENPQKNIIYYKSCDGEPGTCEDQFSKTQVQMMQAVALAQEYAKIKYGHDIVCSAIYRKKNNDDYIKCSDKTGAANYYEFKFDDVKESIDSTIQKNVADALCTMHHGTYNHNCSIRNEYTDDLKSSVSHFGYTTVCNPDIAINRNHSICNIIFNTRDASTYELKTAFGIDPRKFMYLQLQSAADMDFLLKRYTQRQIESSGQTLTQFECADSFQTYKTGNTINNPKDDIISCIANGKPIDFLFDDINEAFDYQAKSGTSGLKCIADSGGTFDGKNCHGLTEKQCTELNNQIPTKWDTTLDTCVLTDANKAATINNIADYAKIIGTGAALITITITTGGAGTMAIIAATGTSLATAGSLITTSTQLHSDSKARDFIAISAKCTTSDCAEDTLKYFINETAAFYDEQNNQLWTTFDEELNRILGLLPENSKFHESLYKTIAEQQDIENYMDWPLSKKLELTGKVWIATGSVMGITGAIGQHWASLINGFKGMVPASKALADTAKKISEVITSNALKNTGRIGDAYGIIDGSSSLIKSF